MFKDTEKELKRLEEELLAEEAEDTAAEETEEAYEDTCDENWEEVFNQAQAETDPQEEDWQDMTRIFYGGDEDWQDKTRVFNVDALQAQQSAQSSAKNVYNTDKADDDLEEYTQQVEAPARKGVTGLVVTAALLTAGILGVVIWWLVRFGGAFG